MRGAVRGLGQPGRLPAEIPVDALDAAPPDGRPSFARSHGGSGVVTRDAHITGEGRPGPADPLVIQVSRWDRLKDMPGVMAAFADHVVPGGGGTFCWPGPSVAEVADDPEAPRCSQSA